MMSAFTGITSLAVIHEDECLVDFTPSLQQHYQNSPRSSQRRQQHQQTQPQQHPKKQAEPSSELIVRSGPAKPNIGKLLAWSKKTPETVAPEMNISQSEFSDLMNGKNKSFERWAPVLATCSLMAKRGLQKILSCESVTQPGLTLKSVGATCYDSLSSKGEEIVSSFVDHCTGGWKEWKSTVLSVQEVRDLFDGCCIEAEYVADLMRALSNATDPTNLFIIFRK